jgi:hypothetical protein
MEVVLPFRTMVAELADRCLDDAFVESFDLRGRFVTQTARGRRYVYYDPSAAAVATGAKRAYVGPADDPALAARVEAFGRLKSDWKARRRLVSTLVREARLPAPDRMVGDVVAAIAAAGFFRLRGLLVGTIAYGCMPAVLGVRLPAASLATSVDLGQDWAVSAMVGDSMPPVMDVLRAWTPRSGRSRIYPAVRQPWHS